MSEMQDNIKSADMDVAKKQQERAYVLKKWKITGIIGAAIVVILIGIGVYNSPSQRVARQLSLGYKYLENQQYEEAIVAFSNAIAIDEKCLEAYAGGIEAYINTDKIEEMQLLYEEALDITRSLDTNALAKNEETVNKLYLSADEIYGNDMEKVTQILEEGLEITENNEEVKKELENLNTQKVNIVFMQKVFDLMAAEDYEAMREIADSEEAGMILAGMQEESYIYIPKDSTGLNGIGVGIYKYGENDYYFFYGNYVNGERTGQGSSFMKISEEDKKLYYFEGIYRTFTGEWKNDAPNGYGREEFVYSNCDEYAEQSGNVVSEGNLKDGLWDGEIKCAVFYSLKTPVLVEFEMNGSYTLANGVPSEEGILIPGNEDYPGIYTFSMAVLYDESGNVYRWIDGYLNEGETMGTIGYGDVNIDEIMEGFAVLQ